MTLPEILGYATAILLIAAFAVNTMTWLRGLAIAAAVALGVYAVLVQHWPLLAIAIILAAVNVWRLVEMQSLVAKAHEASAGAVAAVSVDWLLPYMRPLALPKDHIIFRKGDAADAVYFVEHGRVGFEEIGVEVGRGSLFGEVGALSVDQVRTATAKCLEASSVLVIPAEKFRELYYQNPEFGFALVGLITRRLMEDIKAARPLQS